MTEQEREFNLRSLSEITDRYKTTGTLSPEEGRRALSQAAALREYASRYKQMLLEIVVRVLGLPLNSQKPEKLSFLNSKSEHHTFELARGLTLSLAWDGELTAIALDPQQWRIRAQALSIVGMGVDQPSDVAEKHDEYLADAIQRG